jgi:hypothetical protein
MAYSDFRRLKKVVDLFHLKVERDDFFLDTPVVEPSVFLKTTLEKARKFGFTSEKERSERIVSPVLLEIVELCDFEITLYSGHNLDVDSAQGLKGECDFLMSLGKKALESVEAPIFSVVEAKREDMDHGTAQCLAQLIGVQQFNKENGIEFPCLYGCATDGMQWRFFRVEREKVFLNTKTYLLSELPQILGIFKYAFDHSKNDLKKN